MGGIVVGGRYKVAKFSQFHQCLFPIELRCCYNYQVERYPAVDEEAIKNYQLELMSLDSWLSMAGRTPEISEGNSDLCRTAPALIKKILDEFKEDFEGITESAHDGGFQLIKDVKDNLIDALEDERLSEAEIFFTIVALLRTVKVAHCISLGPSTELIQDILVNDAQVYIV